jgi:PEGA domain.
VVKAGTARAITDSTGRFLVDDVDTGNVSVEVTADGYGPHEVNIEIERGENNLNVVLEDGTLRGVLRENAVVQEPIKKARVWVSERRVKLDGNRFLIDDLPIGQHTVRVEAPGHETWEQGIEVIPGMNEVKATLNLSAVATCLRYDEAKQARHYRHAYSFVHPDVRSHSTLARFVAGEGRGGATVGSRYEKGQPQTGIQVFSPPAKPVTGRGALALAEALNQMSMTFAPYPGSGGVVADVDFDPRRSLAKWRPAYSRKTYEWIDVVDRTLTVRTGIGECFVVQPQHWQQIDGRWYINSTGVTTSRVSGKEGPSHE